MQITVIDVGQANTHTAKNGRSYQSLEVTYKGETGQVGSKKLMSFSNPDVFKQASTWTKGDSVNVNSQKDDNGYWQWIGILGDGEVQQAPQTQTTSAPKTATRVTGSNYETKDERGERQVMIVRQSSLSNAVATLALNKDSGGASSDDVINLAKQYEAYVLGTAPKTLAKSLDDIMDDIPL